MDWKFCAKLVKSNGHGSNGVSKIKNRTSSRLQYDSIWTKRNYIHHTKTLKGFLEDKQNPKWTYTKLWIETKVKML